METTDALVVMTEVIMATMSHIINPIFASPHTWATSMNVREGPASHAFIMCVHLSADGLQITSSTPCLGGFSPSPSPSPPAPETPSRSRRRLQLFETFPACCQTNFFCVIVKWHTAVMIDCDLLNSLEGYIAFVGLVGRLQVFRFQVGPHIRDRKFWPRAYCTLHSYRTSLRH